MIHNKIAYYFLIGFFYIITISTKAQDQRLADSLATIYQSGTLKGEARLELLAELSFNEVNDYQLRLQYADALIQLSEQNENFSYLSQGYFQKGNAKQFLGDL